MQTFLATLTFGWQRKLVIFQTLVVPPNHILTDMNAVWFPILRLSYHNVLKG